MTISLLEWQALTFFGVEPAAAHPWPFDHYTYVIQRDDLSLSFTICPSCHDVRLALTHHDQTLYEFEVLGVEDVFYEQDPVEIRRAHGPSAEVLRITVSGDEEVRLTVNPQIRILHSPRSKDPDRGVLS